MNEKGGPSPVLPQPSRSTLLAVILGAQEWPDMSLPASNAFALSAQAFEGYLTDSNGLNLPKSCIKNLFDSKLTRDDVDREIRQFLEDHYVADVPNFTDLIIYYTGHGDFTRADQHFQLILRSTNKKNTDFSGYTMRQLAATVNGAARKARKLVILDCCYAAAAFVDWQKQGVNDVKQAIQLQADRHFPDNSELCGTALICACDEQKWAIFKDDEPTMFSGGLMDSLRMGDSERGDSLSIGDLYTLTKSAIIKRYPSEAVEPLLHVPKGRREEITSYALFPNPARRVDPFTQRLNALESSVNRFGQQVAAQAATLDGIDSSISALATLRSGFAEQAREVSIVRAALDDIVKRQKQAPTPGSSRLSVSDNAWSSCPRSVRESYIRWRRARANGQILQLLSVAALAAAVAPWGLSLLAVVEFRRAEFIFDLGVCAFATLFLLALLRPVMRSGIGSTAAASSSDWEEQSSSQSWELDPELIRAQTDKIHYLYGFWPVTGNAIIVSGVATMFAAVVAVSGLVPFFSSHSR